MRLETARFNPLPRDRRSWGPVSTRLQKTLSCAQTRHDVKIVKIRSRMRAGSDKQRVSMLINGPDNPEKLLLPLWRYGTHLIIVPWARLAESTAKRYLDRFSRFCKAHERGRLIWLTDWHTYTHHITSHGEDGCRPQWPLYPRNKYLYTTLLLTSI